jgi:uncharacterized membrane protein
LPFTKRFQAQAKKKKKKRKKRRKNCPRIIFTLIPSLFSLWAEPQQIIIIIIIFIYLKKNTSHLKAPENNTQSIIQACEINFHIHNLWGNFN